MNPPGPAVLPAPPPPGPASTASRPAVDGARSGQVVVGDGTDARSRARSRWRRSRGPLLVILGVVVAGLLASLMTPRTSDVPLAPDNPSENGARALAQILRGQGVRIDYVRTSSEAVALAQDDTTLLVVGSYLLTDSQLDAIRASPADLVLAEPEAWHLSAITRDAMTVGGSTTELGSSTARCEDGDAQAAGSVSSSGYGIRAGDPEVAVCFPLEGAGGSVGAYAVLEREDRRIAAFDDAFLMTNDRLDDEGNAALMLRALGRHGQLTWYVPSFGDTGEPPAPSSGALPEWTGPLALQLALVVLALALWRGRALGRIVSEPLPVTVRAAETTLGRGRLYRRSRSYGHAAASLRAGMARRAAGRLGLPRSAGAPEVIDALARATGRSTEQVADLLYGPPPTDDAALLRLATRLDELESEVHRT